MQALAGLLRPGGLLHLFLYADGGRWEIHRTQRALARLAVGSGEEGLRLGRQLLAELPEGNRLRQHHERRWIVDTAADANFADMYLHPQETSYNLERLLAFVASACLEFAGFSNPEVWSPARLLRDELLERAQGLSQLEQWSLVEELDPDISHFEFFLSHGAVRKPDWGDDEVLLAARGETNRCLWGWPATRLMGPDLTPLDVSEAGLNLMAALESAPGVAIGQLPLDWPAAQRIAVARQLLNQRVLLPVL